ncbi:MAG: N-acetylmuramoyl-L-alanine amidase [Pseudomonadota bacterium]
MYPFKRPMFLAGFLLLNNLQRQFLALISGSLKHGCVLLLIIPLYPHSNANAKDDLSVIAVRHALHGELTRLTIELNKNVNFHIFTLANPPRLVIDIPESKLDNTSYRNPKNTLIKQIRSGLFRTGITRLVFDIKKNFIIQRFFTLKPTESNGFRLVSEFTQSKNINRLYSKKSANWERFIAQIDQDADAQISPTPTPANAAQPLIVLDPGHGGPDPGASGKKTLEKHVTLEFAKILADLLQKNNQYRVILTRDHDHYIRLRKRYQKAEQANADLFISIHADSIKNSRLRGTSFYTLSKIASDREARILAQKENQSDILAGFSSDALSDDSDIARILLDMTQQGTLNESAKLVSLLVGQFKKKRLRLLRRPHRFAGFAVLKSPTIPSILVELGFLTNREDERLLNNKQHLQRLSNAIKLGIDQYFMNGSSP